MSKDEKEYNTTLSKPQTCPELKNIKRSAASETPWRQAAVSECLTYVSPSKSFVLSGTTATLRDRMPWPSWVGTVFSFDGDASAKVD
eukprot:133191-Amphidinium_carterae.1